MRALNKTTLTLACLVIGGALTSPISAQERATRIDAGTIDPLRGLQWACAVAAQLEAESLRLDDLLRDRMLELARTGTFEPGALASLRNDLTLMLGQVARLHGRMHRALDGQRDAPRVWAASRAAWPSLERRIAEVTKGVEVQLTPGRGGRRSPEALSAQIAARNEAVREWCGLLNYGLTDERGGFPNRRRRQESAQELQDRSLTAIQSIGAALRGLDQNQRRGIQSYVQNLGLVRNTAVAYAESLRRRSPRRPSSPVEQWRPVEAALQTLAGERVQAFRDGGVGPRTGREARQVLLTGLRIRYDWVYDPVRDGEADPPQPFPGRPGRDPREPRQPRRDPQPNPFTALLSVAQAMDMEAERLLAEATDRDLLSQLPAPKVGWPGRPWRGPIYSGFPRLFTRVRDQADAIRERMEAAEASWGQRHLGESGRTDPVDFAFDAMRTLDKTLGQPDRKGLIRDFAGFLRDLERTNRYPQGLAGLRRDVDPKLQRVNAHFQRICRALRAAHLEGVPDR